MAQIRHGLALFGKGKARFSPIGQDPVLCTKGAGRGHYDVAAGPHKATDQPQILQLTGPRLEAEIGIVP